MSDFMAEVVASKDREIAQLQTQLAEWKRAAYHWREECRRGGSPMPDVVESWPDPPIAELQAKLARAEAQTAEWKGAAYHWREEYERAANEVRDQDEVATRYETVVDGVEVSCNAEAYIGFLQLALHESLDRWADRWDIDEEATYVAHDDRYGDAVRIRQLRKLAGARQ